MAAGRKTGGRTKGTPNKTTTAVKEALNLAFEGVGGVPQLQEWAKENPTEFYKLWVKMLPQQVDMDANVNAAITKVTRQIVDPSA